MDKKDLEKLLIMKTEPSYLNSEGTLKAHFTISLTEDYLHISDTYFMQAEKDDGVEIKFLQSYIYTSQL